MRARVIVKGIVQGVGFRPFVYRLAVRNQLVGYVRNMGDAGVEIVLEGNQQTIERFVEQLKTEKPPLAVLHDVQVGYSNETRELTCFSIVKSAETRTHSGSVIPPDVAICGACASELRGASNRRQGFFFITCTDCGPRYSIIEKLPYDRANTTMRDFQTCAECSREYADPTDRRFHAQTVACHACGPVVWLASPNGERIDTYDPIRMAGRLLAEGNVVAVKGNGGFHLATSTLLTEPVIRLRKTKDRRQKPFAIMARDMDAVRSFAIVSEIEDEFLRSYVRPIVLLKKSAEYHLSEWISPGLHNVGVMLPYTAMHMMLFDGVREPAFVMTSANPPNEPIIKDNDEALKRLRDVVDYFLVHDRRIAQRCDDSVIRVSKAGAAIIRRSRGYAPAPIDVGNLPEACSLGVGAELNATSCLLFSGRAYLTQHVGDVDTLGTFLFHREATNHLLGLTGCRPDRIACDLHPKFTTTRLANQMAKESGYEPIRVQHHHAHVAALMAEHSIEEMVGICCDGYGYGSDGGAWGGEILFCERGRFRRVGHLSEQPMVGGDLATRYPLRMAAGILSRSVDVHDWLVEREQHFPRGRAEVETVTEQLESKGVIETTSCGRVLDAVSAILGICYERTYEGEPAMKLESAATQGRDVLRLRPKINGNILDTSFLVAEVFSKLGNHSVADLACSTQSYIARGLAELAIHLAEESDVKAVGFSGGVAYNEQITDGIRRIVEDHGLRFLVHQRVPPGDGGISFGQAVVAAMVSA